MTTIRDLDSIVVLPDRVRKEIAPNDLEALITSITVEDPQTGKPKGLLHPPVVAADGTLLAGERRYRAIQEIAKRGLYHICDGKMLRPGLICTANIGELTNIQRLEVEVDENVIRVDLTWQEKAIATETLHKLRQMQKDAQSLPGLAPKQEIVETAAEIRGTTVAETPARAVADVQADLLVATWLQAHPDDDEVNNAKSRPEALKIIEVRLEDERRIALARRFFDSRPSGGGHVIQQGDLNVILPQTPPGVYHCIITDPPWGVGAHRWENGGADRRHSYLDDMATADRIHTTLAFEGFRISRERAHLYCFVAAAEFERWAKLFRSAGWDVWPRPIIWSRGSGIAPRAEHGPINTYECILFANKGDKRVLSARADVIGFPKPAQDPRAGAKPAGVYYDLLSRSVLPGDEVLDPCCGSAPVLPACNAIGCRATCYDSADDAIGLALSRRDEQCEPLQYYWAVRSRERKGVHKQRTILPTMSVATGPLSAPGNGGDVP